MRLVWLAVFCLAGIGGLFAVRSALGVSPILKYAPALVTVDPEDDGVPLVKGDRLPSRFIESAPPVTAIETVKIVPIEAPKQQSSGDIKQPEAKDVVSWHWHEGGKVVRRRSQ